MKINAFLENNYKKFELDENLEKILSDNMKNFLNSFLKDSDIKNNSVLKDYTYNLLEFDVVLCNDEQIHELNKNYRNKNTPTDVITFAIFADSETQNRFIFDGEINLGEIFISLDTANKQSTENKNSFIYEMNFLLAHGILHLLGFDHLNEEDYNFMLNKQKNILKEYNVKI